MKDLKFEQKRSLSRVEAADQLSALADALREGGEAELDFGSGTLSLRIPDDLHSEMEVEIGNGEIELEIEFKWPTARKRAAPPATTPAAQEAVTRKSAPAKTGRGADRGKSVKRTAAKK
ncbi:amphi-Trp domain-containing protein [Streptomyces bauhiniae]|uniref:Amphi-Trp domain-containing protein n=1 Tax=Streptomyces bauhiniae TaxID=2340725 RepID=A0A7K3QUN1_9ACTN|nr:amphi-Trp domain-containing protein [Streptomyces bauhiniae]NEB93607.1 amphi-Trp domain-containing protein [Streptomyces bauhiniae]